LLLLAYFVLAYSRCIAHGNNMENGLNQQKLSLVRLLKVAQEQVNLRWKTYEDMAGWKAGAFMPVG
jgi:hypothetical protein